MTRMDLIDHIDSKHKEMIPKGYTATRVVFNLVNKKDHGSCIVCRSETDWDESKARYNRLCNKESCRKKYAKMAKKNTRIDERLKDPEFQQKMLAGRRITGIYKFQDGGEVSYTGTYEKKLLEFMDKFLNENGYINDISDTRLHHEIYMSDARKVAPEKWKTVIRHPIRKRNN